MNLGSKVFLPPEADLLLVNLPKVNLHTHLEGSLRPETLWDLAQDHGVDLGLERTQVVDALQINGKERSLVDYLRKIQLTYPVLKSRQALQRAAFEAAEDAALDGVIYYELRDGPALHTAPGFLLQDVIESILLGLKQAEDRYDIVCRFIVAALRNHDPQTNIDLAKAALMFKRDGVVGYDLAGDEAGYAASEHAMAYQIAREGGLGITVHAGEAGGPENVRYAVEALGAKRIGHGVRSSESEAVMNLLSERQVLLEICPTSNVHTRAVTDISRHPVRKFFQLGIPISINDDDPVTSRTRVSNELTLLQSMLGFSRQELADIQLMAMDAAFLDDESLKADLRKRIESAWKEA